MDEDKVSEPPEHITLRDRFAMAAMTALIARDKYLTRQTSVESYRYADAMLEARQKQ